jgi:hypothetical protein
MDKKMVQKMAVTKTAKGIVYLITAVPLIAFISNGISLMSFIVLTAIGVFLIVGIEGIFKKTGYYDEELGKKSFGSLVPEDIKTKAKKIDETLAKGGLIILIVAIVFFLGWGLFTLFSWVE